MRFMILRKADKHTESGVLPSKELLAAMWRYHETLTNSGALLFDERLRPSADGVRVRFARGQVSVVDGPFAQTPELIAGFSMIDVPSLPAALDWVKHWPALDGDGHAEIEVRDTGCPGGLPEVEASLASQNAEPGQRYLILLKSNASSEADIAPDEKRLAAMGKRNDEATNAGVLLAGEGLHSSAKGARVSFNAGKPVVVDGPFAEIKELIAGFWLIRVSSMQAAIEWVRQYPYPFADADVEIRRLYEARGRGDSAIPESDFSDR